MKRICLIFTVLSFICISYSCFYKNPIERNTIVFNDKVQNVQDSLIKMLALMKKLPKDNIKGLNTNYYFQDDVFYINGDREGKMGSFKIDTVKAILPFSIAEKKEFLSLAKYLQQNFLTSGYFDRSINLWVFEYRETSDVDFNDSRTITILDNNEDAVLEPLFHILDRKNKICLVVPKEAKIR